MEKRRVFYEPEVFDFPLGQKLKKKLQNCDWNQIDNHNNIPQLRVRPNSDFREMKQYLIIGVRKTHKYVPNHKVSDFLVPYTSSGCSAACLYCYLVCNYNKCSYLRLFVNREQMMEKLCKNARQSEIESTYEIGSNSDLVLENTITENLPWTVEQFARAGRGHITFPTKFNMIEPLLDLDHQGRTIVRMSVNPPEIIKSVEIGTSPLESRIEALNKLCAADYPVGLIIAPVILSEGWEARYLKLLEQLEAGLSSSVKRKMFFEIIFMTYSYIHRKINQDAFPNAPDLYDPSLMGMRGRGKYCYKPALRAQGEDFFRYHIAKMFPDTRIIYIV